MSYLFEYEEIDDEYVAFGGDPKGGKIIGKGKSSTFKLDFKDVYFVKEIKFKLFSVSQIRNKKNNALSIDTVCVVLFPDFKLLDESQVLLRVPRKNNMYSVDLKNVAPSRGLTCLFAKATFDESNLWHKRLDINFKTMNKLVKGNLVRGLPSKIFENNHTCVACQKGKQHKASCKFDRNADEGFFVGYSVNSKAFRVFNSRTRIVEENLHINFLENKPNVAGSRPTWLFDIDTLTKSMNYKPVVVGNQSNGSAGKARVKTVPNKYYILLPLRTQDPLFLSSSKDSPGDGFKPSGEEEKKDAKNPRNEDNEVLSTKEPRVNQKKDANVNCTNNINIVSPSDNAAGIKDTVVDKDIVYGCADDPNMPNLEEINYSDDDDDVDAEANMTNLDSNIPVSPISTTRIHKDHPVEQIIKDIHSAPQTRRMTKNVTNYGMFSSVQQRINHKDFQNWLFACFLSQVEPKKVIQALSDPSWIKEMQDELLQFKLQIKAIRLFLAYASFKDFVVYQMDVKSAFMYGKIKEEVYVCQPPGFEDPEFPDRVYKVEKPLYGLHQAPRAWPDIMFAICACARFQVTPKVSHLHAVKRIFRYLKGQPKLGLWYPKDSPFDLEAYSDSDYDGASLDGKSTTGGCLFLRNRLISWQCKKKNVVANSTTEADAKTTSWNKFSSTMASAIICLATNQKFNFSKYIFDNMVKNLEGGVKFLMFLRSVQVFLDKQVEGMFKHKDIYVTPSHTKKVFVNMKRQGKDFSGRATPFFSTMLVQAQQETKKPWRKDTELPQTSVPIEVVTDEAVYKEMYDSMEKAATTATGLDAEQDRGIIRVTLVDETQRRNDQDMFATSVLDDEEVVAKKEVSTADPVTTVGEVVTTVGVEVNIAATTPTISMDDITLAKALAALKSAKPVIKDPSVPKAKGIIMQEPEETTIRTTTTVSSQREDLKTLWKLVKAKYGNSRLEEVYERVLWGNLKEGFMLTEMRSKTYQRRDKDSLENKNTYEDTY
nr:ribonuclease H-like domain-containing protein [Tanacetum cinerariifolium]